MMFLENLFFTVYLFTCRVDQEFQDRLKYYMNTSVAEDIQSMSTATPALHRLKSLLGKEVDSTHRSVSGMAYNHIKNNIHVQYIKTTVLFWCLCDM